MKLFSSIFAPVDVHLTVFIRQDFAFSISFSSTANSKPIYLRMCTVKTVMTFIKTVTSVPIEKTVGEFIRVKSD